MKDTCSIAVHNPAKAVVTDHGDIMIAISHVGKGVVLAVVDPWIYNEYADGFKMRQYDGFEAADEPRRLGRPPGKVSLSFSDSLIFEKIRR